jgi:hypothetical protein
LESARDEALVIGANNLCQEFEGEGGTEEEPELTRVTGRAAGDEKGAEGGEEGHGGVEGIGEEEASSGGANKFEVEDEKQRQEESGGDGNPRKLAGGEQDDLTSDERDKPGGARNGKSVHHSVALEEEGQTGEF